MLSRNEVVGKHVDCRLTIVECRLKGALLDTRHSTLVRMACFHATKSRVSMFWPQAWRRYAPAEGDCWPCHQPARLLEETGVALLPGAAFVRSRAELTARLAYVDFDGASALAASPDYSSPPRHKDTKSSKTCGTDFPVGQMTGWKACPTDVCTAQF